MNFEAGSPPERTEAEQEAILQERVAAATAIPENYPDKDAAWQAKRMIEILEGKLHVVHEPEPRMKGNLGEAWDV
jgi:hypothetical protein